MSDNGIPLTGHLQPKIDYSEHDTVNGVHAKKVIVLDTEGNMASFGQMYGYDPLTDTWRPLEVVESTTNPGHYVLAVGNTDGSPITGGSAEPDTTGYNFDIYDTSVYA